MKNQEQWQSTINDKNYEFSYKKNKGNHEISVNGTMVSLKAGLWSSLLGFDENFTFDGTEARLIVDGKGPDVAVNGAYLQSGKKYIERPAWVMIFVILCILIPVLSLGGALPVLLGLGGAAICVGASKADLPMAVRILLCIAITALAWGALFALGIGIALLL